MIWDTSSRLSLDSCSTSQQPVAKFFYEYYLELCRKYNFKPFLRVNNQKTLSKVVLYLTTDLITFEDWIPIIQALFYDTSLHLIEVKARRPILDIVDYFDNETKIKLHLSDRVNWPKDQKKFNFLQTKFIVEHFVAALSNCILRSEVLSYISLNGILLKELYLGKLLCSIESTNRLQHLSLDRCHIGDEGCELIYQKLRNVPSLISINISNCNITEIGINYIVNLIKFQKNYRFSEVWKISLRDRKADINEMQGLRRLSMNNNPAIGDNGIELLIDVLLDDLWIKAIDLQNCGLTNQLENQIRNLLSINHNIEIFDVRQNRKMPSRISNEFFMLLKQFDRGNANFQWNSTAVIHSNNTATNKSTISVIPFRSKYINENLELLNAKKTISSLQQQLKLEQSKLERAKLLHKNKKPEKAIISHQKMNEYSVLVDIRDLTEFLKELAEFLPSTTFTDTYLNLAMKKFYDKLKNFILKSVTNDQKFNPIHFDEDTFQWVPKFQKLPVLKNDPKLKESNEHFRSNFTSCNNTYEEEDNIQNLDFLNEHKSFVIRELLNSFSTFS